MRLTVLPGKLKEALAVAKEAADGRVATLPSLGMVLISATADGHLVASGTDTHARAWHTVPAKVEAAGAVCLPPKAISDYLDAVAKDEGVTLTIDQAHKAALVSGRSQLKVAGLDPETFPVAPDLGESATSWTMPAGAFASLVNSVAHAAHPETSRPVLAGVLIRIRDGVATFAAADGYRMAMRSAEIEGAPDIEIIVPAKRLGQIASTLRGYSDDARLTIDGDQRALRVETDLGCWSVQLIAGQYPDLGRVIKIEPKTRVTVAREDLERACSLVSGIVITITKDSRSCKVTRANLTISADGLAIRASDSEADHEADTVLSAEVEGEPISLGIDNGYLREAVKALGGDRITLTAETNLKPIVIGPAGDESGRYLQAVMPMAPLR